MDIASIRFVRDTSSPPAYTPTDECAQTIAASDQEPFTLETFASLAYTHYLARKAMLLARVRSQSTNQEYVSIYAAHPMNRALFRFSRATLISHPRLYRTTTLNPMNNLAIVPPVEYYAIPYEELCKGVGTSLERPGPSVVHDHPYAPSMTHVPLDSLGKRQLDATFFATEDDFLQNVNVRKYFYKNALDDGERRLLVDSGFSAPRSTPLVEPQRRVLPAVATEFKILLLVMLYVCIIVAFIWLLSASMPVWLLVLGSLVLALLVTMFLLLLISA
jgi:hypothetical protein